METDPITNKPEVQIKQVEADLNDMQNIEKGLDYGRAVQSDMGQFFIKDTKEQIGRTIDALFSKDLSDPNLSLNFFINVISGCKSNLQLLEKFGLKMDLGRMASERQIKRALRIRE